MKNFLKKLLVGAALCGLVSGPAFAFSETVDRLGTGTTAVPVLTSCGTTPTIVGSDFAGVITVGTGSPTTCTITFSAAFTVAPSCILVAVPLVAAFTYTISTTAISVTETGSTGKINYICVGI